MAWATNSRASSSASPGNSVEVVMAAETYLKVMKGLERSRRSTNRTNASRRSSSATGSNSRGSKLPPAASMRSLDTEPRTPAITTSLP